MIGWRRRDPLHPEPRPFATSMLMGRVPGQRPAHRASSQHVQAIYPFVSEGGLGGRGIYVGRDQSGGSFVFDPHVLYAMKVITNPNTVLFGEIGCGKSSLIKCLAFRGHPFGRRVWINDIKGEYVGLGEALDAAVLAMRPGGKVRINPIGRHVDEARRLGVLVAITRATLGRPLTPEEDAACREALRVLSADVEGEATLPQVHKLLFHPTPAMTDALSTTSDELAAHARNAALAILRLCEGELRGLFDGPTTEGLRLDGHVIVDLSWLQETPGLPVVMICTQAWMAAQVEARNARLEATGGDASALWQINDESWRTRADEQIAAAEQANYKLTRAKGVANFAAYHNILDVSAAGDAGSRVARLNEGLMTDSSTRIIGRQEPELIPLTREKFGLTRRQGSLLGRLGPGWFLWIVGGRTFLVQHLRSSIEETFTDTDGAMRVRRQRQPAARVVEVAA